MHNLMNQKSNIVEIDPVFLYPVCILSGKKQDCFTCDLFRSNGCTSTRSKCLLPYRNHKKGCPNYGKRKDCPPFAPLFKDVFDVTKPVYGIYSIFDLRAHVEKMKAKHPSWTEAQLRNLLYWQGTARKELRIKINEFNNLYKVKGYSVTTSPEAMGIDVTTTFKNIGIELEWPVINNIYKIAVAGYAIDGTLT